MRSVVSLAVFPQPPLEESSLGGLLGKVQGPPVGGTGFLPISQPPVQVRPCGVSQVIIFQLTCGKEIFDEYEARIRTVVHRYGHGAVKRDHGRWVCLQQ